MTKLSSSCHNYCHKNRKIIMTRRFLSMRIILVCSICESEITVLTRMVPHTVMYSCHARWIKLTVTPRNIARKWHVFDTDFGIDVLTLWNYFSVRRHFSRIPTWKPYFSSVLVVTTRCCLQGIPYLNKFERFSSDHYQMSLDVPKSDVQRGKLGTPSVLSGEGGVPTHPMIGIFLLTVKPQLKKFISFSD